MGMVVVDLNFRLEKLFKVRFPKDWLERLGIRVKGGDATLAQLEALLIELCHEQCVQVPTDPFSLITEAVEAASGINAKALTLETQLIRDIAPFGY